MDVSRRDLACFVVQVRSARFCREQRRPAAAYVQASYHTTAHTLRFREDDSSISGMTCPSCPSRSMGIPRARRMHTSVATAAVSGLVLSWACFSIWRGISAQSDCSEADGPVRFRAREDRATWIHGEGGEDLVPPWPFLRVRRMRSSRSSDARVTRGSKGLELRQSSHKRCFLRNPPAQEKGMGLRD